VINARHLLDQALTKYLFFTGKGGVGKTSTACALAVNLSERGKSVFLVSTDPASNLQDVFGVALTNQGTAIPEYPNLLVANFEPEAAAAAYRESVVGPYRGLLPEDAIANMEEQLSGSCTVEIAAFNEFTQFLTDVKISDQFDHVIFDTAPTGHTLRMLELPAAWATFIDNNQSGASCLGQLSGLGEQKDVYQRAVQTLCDSALTTLVLVARPEESPLKEAARASKELGAIGIEHQVLIVNGLLEEGHDQVGQSFTRKQSAALEMLKIDPLLKGLKTYSVTLKPFSIMGAKALKHFFGEMPVGADVHEAPPEKAVVEKAVVEKTAYRDLEYLIDALHASGQRVIFTMGKGGVGKTTMATAIAKGLNARGEKVHLTSTDPASNLPMDQARSDLKVSFIDEVQALATYKADVLSTGLHTMTPDELAYLEEDLSSPCTQEIAVFRAFAQLVESATDEIVVIDTAPTGHTLLLLDASLSYHKEIERSSNEVPNAVKSLLPKLRDPDHTTVVIVTIAEPTPVHEATRLAEDLERAGIQAKWWIVNSSFAMTQTASPVLAAKGAQEWPWIEQVDARSQNHFILVPWQGNQTD